MSSWSSLTIGGWFAIALDWLFVVATIFDDFQLLGVFFATNLAGGGTLG
jgi:hypothetical protein